MLVAVLYSLGAMVGFGVASAVGKTLVQRHGAIAATLRREVFSVGALFVAVLFVGVPEVLDVRMLLFGIGIVVLSYGGPLFQMMALERGHVGVVIPATSMRIVVMALVGFVALGEVLTLQKIVMLFLVTAGILIATVDLRTLHASDLFRIQSGVPYALVAALVWGLTMPFFGIPSIALGSIFFALVIELTITVCALIHVHMANVPLGTWRESLWPECVVGVGLAAGVVFLNAALATGEISIASSISGASVLVSVLVGAVLYNERLRTQQYIGAAVVTIGILLPILMML